MREGENTEGKWNREIGKDRVNKNREEYLPKRGTKRRERKGRKR